MSIKLKTYEQYKSTNQEWLGMVPAHWEVVSHRAVFREIIDKGHPDEPLLSVTIGSGIIQQRDLLSTSSKKDSSNDDKGNYKLVQVGDIAYNKMRAWQGALGFASFKGIVSPAYIVVRPYRRQNPSFYHYLMRTPAFMTEAERWSYGITSDQWSLRAEDFKCIHTVVPPLPEQDAIVHFIRHIDHRVNRLIKSKRGLIELLNEQKQAIIHHAVTRGLDPRMPLKHTGNKWFPTIPEKWSVVPLRRVIARAVDGPHHSPSYVDHGVMFISARNVKVDKWSLGSAKYISHADYEEFSRRIKPNIGDVLYTKGGTTGVARTVDLSFPFQVWVHIAVLKLRRKVITPEFLTLALNSPQCYNQAQLYTRGATNQDLGLGRMKDIILPLPPSILEQADIADYLTAATGDLRRTISNARQEIELLREYRTRLISDVVTGQLDVRSIDLQYFEEGEGLADVEEPNLGMSEEEQDSEREEGE